jgi:hypothetical protein
MIDRRNRSPSHLEDAAHFPGGRADGIAKPRTEAEVSALVAAATHVLPIGAQSSVTGGATPTGGLLLSTERLKTIESAAGNHVRSGAGVPLDTLQEHLAAEGRWYPPTPTFTGAFVGGVIATNAAGAATFKHGTTRQWIDGLTLVLPCGHVLDLMRGDVTADPARGFEIVCDCGTRRFAAPTYRMPAVPKCAAGYFSGAEHGSDRSVHRIRRHARRRRLCHRARGSRQTRARAGADSRSHRAPGRGAGARHPRRRRGDVALARCPPASTSPPSNTSIGAACRCSAKTAPIARSRSRFQTAPTCC